MEDCRVMYECMYHSEDDFDAEFGETSGEDKLDIVESFVRVTPTCNAHQERRNGVPM